MLYCSHALAAEPCGYGTSITWPALSHAISLIKGKGAAKRKGLDNREEGKGIEEAFGEVSKRKEAENCLGWPIEKEEKKKDKKNKVENREKGVKF